MLSLRRCAILLHYLNAKSVDSVTLIAACKKELATVRYFQQKFKNLNTAFGVP